MLSWSISFFGDYSPSAIGFLNWLYLSWKSDSIAQRPSWVVMWVDVVVEIFCCMLGFEELEINVLVWWSWHRLVRELGCSHRPLSPKSIVATSYGSQKVSVTIEAKDERRCFHSREFQVPPIQLSRSRITSWESWWVSSQNLAADIPEIPGRYSNQQ